MPLPLLNKLDSLSTCMSAFSAICEDLELVRVPVDTDFASLTEKTPAVLQLPPGSNADDSSPFYIHPEIQSALTVPPPPMPSPVFLSPEGVARLKSIAIAVDDQSVALYRHVLKRPGLPRRNTRRDPPHYLVSVGDRVSGKSEGDAAIPSSDLAMVAAAVIAGLLSNSKKKQCCPECVADSLNGPATAPAVVVVAAGPDGGGPRRAVEVLRRCGIASAIFSGRGASDGEGDGQPSREAVFQGMLRGELEGDGAAVENVRQSAAHIAARDAIVRARLRAFPTASTTEPLQASAAILASQLAVGAAVPALWAGQPISASLAAQRGSQHWRDLVKSIIMPVGITSSFRGGDKSDAKSDTKGTPAILSVKDEPTDVPMPGGAPNLMVDNEGLRDGPVEMTLERCLSADSRGTTAPKRPFDVAEHVSDDKWQTETVVTTPEGLAGALHVLRIAVGLHPACRNVTGRSARGSGSVVIFADVLKGIPSAWLHDDVFVGVQTVLHLVHGETDRRDFLHLLSQFFRVQSPVWTMPGPQEGVSPILTNAAMFLGFLAHPDGPCSTKTSSATLVWPPSTPVSLSRVPLSVCKLVSTMVQTQAQRPKTNEYGQVCPVCTSPSAKRAKAAVSRTNRCLQCEARSADLPLRGRGRGAPPRKSATNGPRAYGLEASLLQAIFGEAGKSASPAGLTALSSQFQTQPVSFARISSLCGWCIGSAAASLIDSIVELPLRGAFTQGVTEGKPDILMNPTGLVLPFNFKELADSAP